MGGWEAERLAGRRLRYQFADSEPLYILLVPRLLRPGRLGGWEDCWLSVKVPTVVFGTLYIPLEPRFLRPGKLGRLGEWMAGWAAVNVPTSVFGTPIYTFRATIPEAWEARREKVEGLRRLENYRLGGLEKA